MTASIFTVGGTVQADKRLYLTRKADEELLALCRAGTFAYILAPRQMGKSSLMMRTSHRLAEEGTRSVIIDLTQLGTQVTAEAWYLGLLAIIEDQLLLDTSAVEWWKAHADLGITQRLTRFFEEVLLSEVDGPVVIFIDEIDTTLSLTFTDDFFASIRYFYQARVRLSQFQRLSFVLIGVATPGDLIRDPARTPFNIGQRLDMTDFTLEEALPLTEGLQLPSQQAHEVLSWVLKWTGGHPYLTQRLCQVLVEQKGKTGWTEAEIDELVTNTFFGERSEQDNNLQFVRDMLTKRATNQEEVLLTYRDIRIGRRPVVDQEQSLAKSHLKLAGVVKRKGQQLQVRNAIYRTVFDEKWIREHLPINWAKRLRQAWRLIGASFALTILMTGLAIFAFVQQNEAKRQENLANNRVSEAIVARNEAIVARNGAVAAQTQAERLQHGSQAQRLALQGQLAADPEVGMLLAIEASERILNGKLEDVNGLTESALRQLTAAYNPNRVLQGHTGTVRAVSFSPDGKWLLTTSADDTARLWEVSSGKELRVLRHSKGTIHSASFSPDGKQIITTGTDGIDRVWETDTGREMLDLAVGSNFQATDAAFSPDGKQIVSAESRLVRLWDSRTGKNLLTIDAGSSAAINGVTFSPNGNLILTNDGDGNVKGFEASSGQSLFVLSGHQAKMKAIRFSPDGTKLVSISQDNLPRVWEINTGKLLFELRGHSARVNRAVFSPDGKLIATVSDDTTTRLWDSRTGQEVKNLRGHTAIVWEVAFSPDGSWLVTTSQDNTIKVWDLFSGLPLQTLLGHSGPVEGYYNHSGLVFSPDGNLLATASDDATIRLWDWQAIQKKQLILSGHGDALYSAAISSDGKQVVTGTGFRDSLVRLWNAQTGKLVSTMTGHIYATVFGVTFSPDGKLILSSGEDGTSRLWDSATGQQVGFLHDKTVVAVALGNSRSIMAFSDKTVQVFEGGNFEWKDNMQLRGHTEEVRGIALSPDERYIVTASADKTARLWEVSTRKNLFVLQSHTAEVNSAGFAPDGKHIVTASADKTARLWDSATGQELMVLSGHDGAVNRATFSPDGKYIVTASADKTARLWEANTGKVLLVLSGHSAGVRDATFSLDGKYVVTAAEDGTARVWEVTDLNQSIVTTPLQILKGHSGAINRAIFLPDGKSIVTGGEDRSVRLWDVSTGQAVKVQQGHAGAVLELGFQPDGSVVRSAGSDYVIIAYQVSANFRYLQVLPTQPLVYGATFSPDGKFILSGSTEGNPRLWETNTGKLLATLTGHSGIVAIGSKAFSPDGKLAVTAGKGDNTARLWEVATGKALFILKGHTKAVNDAAFSADGKYIVTASADKTARIWEASSGKEAAVLKGHTDAVNSARFSLDNRFILTASEDNTIRLWEVATGRELLVLHQHQGAVTVADFSPDGRLILSGSKDNTARLYNCEVCGSFEEVLAVAKSKVTRQLTPEERKQYGLE